MTAHLISNVLQSSLNERFSPHLDSSSSAPYRHPGKKSPSRKHLEPLTRTNATDSPDISLLWGSVLELLQQGVFVISRNLKPVYLNLKARELCQHLAHQDISPTEMPTVLSEVCHRLIRENRPTDRPVVMEYKVGSDRVIRIHARWLHNSPAHAEGCMPKLMFDEKECLSQVPQRQTHILVLLEDCYDLLRDELQIERKKYDLTEREAEIWMLLRQEYTYQEIAKLLQISLNTVKTHVKNVYAKRRSFQGQEKFWCSE